MKTELHESCNNLPEKIPDSAKLCVLPHILHQSLNIYTDKSAPSVTVCNSGSGVEDESGCSEEYTELCEGNHNRYMGGSNPEQCDKFYTLPSGGDCGENLKCIARDGKFMGYEICVPSDFICDNTLQCQGGQDEDKCEARYLDKKIFSVNEGVICTSRSLNITKIGNGTGYFFPYRGMMVYLNIQRAA